MEPDSCACFDGNLVTTHCRSCWAQKGSNFLRFGAMDSSLMWNKVSVVVQDTGYTTDKAEVMMGAYHLL